MYKAAIIGGGFYGLCLALYLNKSGMSVTIIEKESSLMQRASLRNQARIHMGYHYPRNILTAYRSRVNYPLFWRDFEKSCVSDFQILYGIARNNSKITSSEYYNLFKQMGLNIEICHSEQRELFNLELIDKIYRVTEYVFDATTIKTSLENKINHTPIRILLNNTVHNIFFSSSFIINNPHNETLTEADCVFNCAYSQINIIREQSTLNTLPIKNELTEMALIQMPPPLNQLGITIMDGPFFSCMPYPSSGSHTLSHVRYTPHTHWTDSNTTRQMETLLNTNSITSNYSYMLNDSARFLPLIKNSTYLRSLYEIKSTLLQNEFDDGRPILFHEEPKIPGFFTILGGKIDNIYDLLSVLGSLKTRYKLQSVNIADLFN